MYSNVYVQAVLVGGGYIALEVASQLAGEGVGVCRCVCVCVRVYQLWRTLKLARIQHACRKGGGELR
jgi:NADH dehydrogenase FAD-containing subunit